MQQATEATKVRVFKTPGWLIIRAPKDQGFLDDMHRLPLSARKFCSSIAAWAVRLDHKDDVIADLKKRFNLRKVTIS